MQGSRFSWFGKTMDGNASGEMTLVLVDDRDGRVITKLESPEERLRLLEAMAKDDQNMPEYLCIVSLRDRPGAILGTESSVTVRPLQR